MFICCHLAGMEEGYHGCPRYYLMTVVVSSSERPFLVYNNKSTYVLSVGLDRETINCKIIVYHCNHTFASQRFFSVPAISL